MREIKIGDVRFKVDDPTHEAHWNSVESGGWQPWIFPIYNQYLDSDRCYIDFGAWIGATVLYASRKARHCYAFEPDPVAFKVLRGNVSSNPDIKNITLVNAAIWNGTGLVRMCTETDSLGNSDTSLMLDTDMAMGADAITFSDFRALQFSVVDPRLLDVDDCNLMKFDIEGAEFAVIEDMIDFLEEKMPTIILSAHLRRVDSPKKEMKQLKSMLGFYKYCYDIEKTREIGDGICEEMLFTNKKWFVRE